MEVKFLRIIKLISTSKNSVPIPFVKLEMQVINRRALDILLERITEIIFFYIQRRIFQRLEGN